MSDNKQAENPAPRRGDLTQGPILRTLIGFAIPTVTSNLLYIISGTISMIWVGQLLGERAVAATTNGNIIMVLAYTFIFGFAMAMTVRIGQAFGASRIKELRLAYGGGLGFCLVLSLAWTILGWLMADRLVELLATPAVIREQSAQYIRLSFLTVPFMTVGQAIMLAMRAIGEARPPAYTMIVQTLICTVLNPLFIIGWGPIQAMGINGAAMANILANAVGTAILLVLIHRHDLVLKLRVHEWRHLIPTREEAHYLLTKGIPVGGQMLVTSAAGVIFMGLVNREGMLMTAAYGVILQTWSYIQIPGSSISMGVSAIVAQSMGAGQDERIGRVTLIGIAVNTALTVTLTALLLIFDVPLLELFLGSSSASISIAEHIQLLTTWTWILSGVMMVMIGIMRCYGAVMLPLVIMTVAQYPVRLGFYYMAYPYMGADALWWGFSFSAITAMSLTTWMFLRGNWRSGRARHDAISFPDPPG